MSQALLISHLALWLVVAVQTLVLLGLIKTVLTPEGNQQTLGADDHTLEGRLAPDFIAEAVSGGFISSADFDDRPRVLLFLSPNCSNCAVTLGELEALKHKASGELIMICQDRKQTCERLVELYGLDYPVLIDDNYHVTKRFGIVDIPAAVIIGANNRVIRQGQRLDEDALERMLVVKEDASHRDLRMREVNA